MLRRKLSLVALTLAALAVTACAAPTAPKQDCQITGGTHTCH